MNSTDFISNPVTVINICDEDKVTFYNILFIR